MFQKTNFWIFSLAISILFFTKGISLTFYDEFPILLALISGFTVALIIQFIVRQKTINTKNKFFLNNKKYSGYLRAALFVLTLCGFSFFMIKYQVYELNEELNKNGKYVVAKIVDNNNLRIKKNEISSLNIEFKDENDNLVSTTLQPTNTNYKQAYKEQLVEIVYSKRYPSIIKKINSIDERKLFTNNDLRTIELKDLVSFYNKNTPQIFNELNKICPNWTYEYQSSYDVFMFKNEMLDIYLEYHKKGKRFCLVSYYFDHNLENQLLGLKSKNKYSIEKSFSIMETNHGSREFPVYVLNKLN